VRTALSVTDDTKKMSLVAYDSLGATVQYDYYFTKTGVITDANGAVTGSTWEVAVYRNADAATGSTTSFPTPLTRLALRRLSFDANGQLTSATRHGHCRSGHGKDNHDGLFRLHPARFRLLGDGFG
jgi:flagellar hook protein FlgE